MGRKGKWEYFRAIYGRYQKADRQARQVMLNEFCLTTGYHRKYATVFQVDGITHGSAGAAVI